MIQLKVVRNINFLYVSAPRRYLKGIQCTKLLLVPARYEYFVGICKPLYFGLPEDGAHSLKHVGILYVT